MSRMVNGVMSLLRMVVTKISALVRRFHGYDLIAFHCGLQRADAVDLGDITRQPA